MIKSLVSLSDEDVRAVLTPAAALQVVRDAFTTASRGTGQNFPVVREKLEHAIFGVKSGADSHLGVLGLKAGGAFPKNIPLGRQAHQSSVILFDFDTGHPVALVAGNAITALRTAAAAALSIDLMARSDARKILMVGAGAQAETHLRAALNVRHFDEVYAWSRDADLSEDLARRVADVTDLRPQADLSIVPDCDVIITLTPSSQPMIGRDQVSPGTHLVCMGADTVGKQEVAAELVAASRVFTDDINQSLTIGECQSAFRAGMIGRDHVRGSLGDVILGEKIGRENPDEITLFDGTGVALQDLLAAAFVLRSYQDQAVHRA
ncbi:ornithine cyclodeaminase family protein [Rhizobium herbae]